MKIGDDVIVKETGEIGTVNGVGRYGLLFLKFYDEDRNPFARKVYDPNELKER
jgi:uncharacterized protein YodC (DUF2158 family)